MRNFFFSSTKKSPANQSSPANQFPISDMQIQNGALQLSLNPKKPNAHDTIVSSLQGYLRSRHRQCCKELPILQRKKTGELADDYRYSSNADKSIITITNNLIYAMEGLCWMKYFDKTKKWSPEVKQLIETAEKHEIQYPISDMALNGDTLVLTLNPKKYNASEIIAYHLKEELEFLYKCHTKNTTSTNNDNTYEAPYHFEVNDVKANITITGDLSPVALCLYCLNFSYDHDKKDWPEPINQLLEKAAQELAEPPSPEPTQSAPSHSSRVAFV